VAEARGEEGQEQERKEDARLCQTMTIARQWGRSSLFVACPAWWVEECLFHGRRAGHKKR
jgi:hypothetical protein